MARLAGGLPRFTPIFSQKQFIMKDKLEKDVCRAKVHGQILDSPFGGVSLVEGWFRLQLAQCACFHISRSRYLSGATTTQQNLGSQRYIQRVTLPM